MKKKIGKFLLPLLAVVMLGFSVLHMVRAQQTPLRPTPAGQPPHTPFARTVCGSGMVEPETDNIAIGSALPGVVLEVYVPVEKVGQTVKKGAPLFLVDNRQLKAQLRYHEANLAVAKAQLSRLEAMPRPEELPPSQAKVRIAKANVDLKKDLAHRNRKLMPTRSVSEEDYWQKRLAVEVALQELAQVEAESALLKAGAWTPDKTIARAAVVLAEAQLEQTRTDLERSLVRAPMDGKVLQVNVRAGEYVGTPPGQALIVLGSINRLHVRVWFDEHDIPRAWRFFKRGATAIACVRGDQERKLRLVFVRVEPYVIPKKSLTGDNTERVDTRVLQVIYRVEQDEPGLFVGMQTDVFLDLGE